MNEQEKRLKEKLGECSGKDFNVGKIGYRTIILVGLLCFALGFSCYASDSTSSNNISGTEEYNAGESEGQDAGRNGELVGTVSEIDGSTVSETTSVREELLTFAPAEQIVEGSATMTDVYNVLASIHNMLIIMIFINLIQWAYKVITESYRRFLKNV